MGFTKAMLLCSITLTVIKFPSPSLGKATACTAGDFAAGQNASLLCFFPEDIDAHDSVYVQYTPFSAPTGASATPVLLCKVRALRESDCKASVGYNFKSYTRNTLSVYISNVTEKSAGSYVCQFLPPPHKSSREMCNLTVRGVKPEAVTPVNQDKHHSTTFGKQQDSSTDVQSGETGTVRDGTPVGVIVGVIVGVLVGIIIVAAAVISIVYIVCRHKRDSKSSGSTHLRAANESNPSLTRTLITTEGRANDADTPLVNKKNDSTVSPLAGSNIRSTSTTPGNRDFCQRAGQSNPLSPVLATPSASSPHVPAGPGPSLSVLINPSNASTPYALAGPGPSLSVLINPSNASTPYALAGPGPSLSVLINPSNASTPYALAGPGPSLSVLINPSNASTPCALAGPGMSLPMMMDTPRASTPCASAGSNIHSTSTTPGNRDFCQRAGQSNPLSPVLATPSASSPHVPAGSGNHTSATNSTPCNSASPLAAQYKGSAETTTDKNDFEGDSGVEMSGRKSPDKAEGKCVPNANLAQIMDLFSVNDYYKNEKCLSFVIDSNKSESTPLVVYVNALLKRVEEIVESTEEVKSGTASSGEPSGDSKRSQEVLEKYLKYLSEFKTKENVQQAIDCIKQLVGHVERHEVDAQIHEAIQRMAPNFPPL